MNFGILNCGGGGAFYGPSNHMAFAHSHPAFFVMFFVAAASFVLFIKFLVAYIVYKDAASKNIENRKIWFFLVFVTSILGAIFYFIMVVYQHKNNTLPRSASSTQNQAQGQASTQQLSTSRTCKNCGTAGDGKFCTICGTQLR